MDGEAGERKTKAPSKTLVGGDAWWRIGRVTQGVSRCIDTW